MNKRLFFFPFFCLLIFTICTSFTDTGFLFWSKQHRLLFSDFKGVPPALDTVRKEKLYNTHKFGVISKSIDVKLMSKAGKTTFTIYAGMNQHDSWIRHGDDSVTLRHEQGHFDICELYARMLRKEIRNAKTLAEAKDLYEKISDAENVEQDAFDGENTFALGGITDKWLALINERLKALEAYESPLVIVSIYK